MPKVLFRFISAIMLTLAASAAGFRAYAQEEEYKFDLGIGAGMSGYLGDVNYSNMFRRPGFAAQVAFRYLPDVRWAIRGVFTTASISGNTADSNMQLPGDAVYSFTSQVYDLGCRGEFNFFPYGIGETYKRLRRWTPYLALGIGATLATPGGGSPFVTMSLPMAFGLKLKLRPRLNLAAEFCMTYLLGDRADNLSDLYQIKSTFLKNNDWHSNLMIGISYEFGKRCVTCHYKE
ncbi:MAG: outer membrane beta-barrel protein [Muribaculaceae bacterium]|nr:outer membrane beta-barrel protein [Muribaculaceae bacterium]